MSQTQQQTNSSDQKDEAPRKKEQVVVKAIVATCSLFAWAFVLFVPIWKIIDTSYLFRERDDPSLFDKVTDYFSSESSWPFAKAIDNGKDTYRVYFFIMPFAIAFLFVAMKGIVATKYRLTQWKAQLPRFLRYKAIRGLSVLDLMLITATLVYSVVLLWARMKRSLTRGARKLTFFYQDSKDGLDPFSWEGTEVMAKSLGVLSIVLLGWFVLMPVSRKSVLLEVFGVPWDAAVKYHRWLGWYTLAVFLSHTFVYIAVWAKADGDPLYDPEGNLLRHMMVPGSCNDGSCDSDTEKLHMEMMYGFGSLLIMIIMSAFAIEYVRRRYFELFYYTHQLFRLMIIFLCFHYGKTMLYLLPGVVMILIDKTIGYLAILGSTKAAARALTKDIIELRVAKDPNTYCEAGQYVFVNVPSVSVLQWHPITVTWATENEMALHIKSRGKETWTQLVFDHVWSRDGYINVKLDGFYGSNHIETHGLLRREAVLFFCGGCAITFPFNIITELCNADATLPVYLTWITRTREEYAAFEGLLLDLKKRFENLSISVWVTLHSQPSSDDDWPFFNLASTPRWTIAKDDFKRPLKFWRPFATWLWPMYIHAAVTAVAIIMGCLGYSLSRKHNVDEERTGETRALVFNRLLDYLIVVAIASGFLYALIGLRFLWAALQRKRRVAGKLQTPSTSEDISTEDEYLDSVELDAVERGPPRPFTPSTFLEDTSMEDEDFDSVELDAAELDTVERGLPPPNLLAALQHERREVAQTTSTFSEDFSMKDKDLDSPAELDSVDERGSLINTCFGDRPKMNVIFEKAARDYPTNVAVLNCGPRGMVDAVKDEYQKHIGDGWILSTEEWEW